MSGKNVMDWVLFTEVHIGFVIIRDYAVWI